VRTDVEADIAHVVEMLARDEPHDVTDLPLAVVAGERENVFAVTCLFDVSSVA